MPPGIQGDDTCPSVARALESLCEQCKRHCGVARSVVANEDHLRMFVIVVGIICR